MSKFRSVGEVRVSVRHGEVRVSDSSTGKSLDSIAILNTLTYVTDLKKPVIAIGVSDDMITVTRTPFEDAYRKVISNYGAARLREAYEGRNGN